MDEHLRLSAQRALLGRITRGLRAVSVEKSNNVVKWRCVFGSEVAKESQWELLSEAAAELIADFEPPTKIEEEYIVVRFRDSEQKVPNEIPHLKHIVFLRHERESYPELAINT
ncbi:hypothetical protein [Microbulbifer thermotolerans]|nr:hypothetical protein [Microbulbifer thermotolerans]MCX2803262.1 hypothetical protein [Microbulbifer thermotolerans]